MLHASALYISFYPAAISCYCGVSLDKQTSMETTDNPSASADNHGAPGPRGSPPLDADPLLPRALEYLADWEIKELILRLEAEQRRREQAMLEEAERIRRQNPRPCFHLFAYCQKFCVHKSHSIGEQQQHDQWHRCDAHWYYSQQPGM